MQKFSFKIIKKDKKSVARLGTISTSHGNIQTPAFSPVATRATVRTLDIKDLKDAHSQVVLANTYHLYLRPGIKTISKFGGFPKFMGWDGPAITDSGGYQVSFLWNKSKTSEGESFGKVIKITDEGATFASYLDGSRHLLTPEKSMEIQDALGADIIMAFDQPLGKDDSIRKLRESYERTLLWEERSLVAWQKLKNSQALYGIVQGGVDKKLRRKSLQFILDAKFLGIAMGGETIGSDPEITSKSLDTILDLMPEALPVHALGLGGGPEGIFEAVARGIDTFDNTSITRMARCGLLFIYPEDGGNVKNKFRIDIAKALYVNSKKPISKVCKCLACQNYSVAYIHHLIVSKELTGLRLASIHNIYFINELMQRIRTALGEGNYSDLKKHWLGRVDKA